MFVVLFACVIEDANGLLIDCPYNYGYLGGYTQTKEEADRLAKHIVNDKNIPGAIIPRVFPIKENDTIQAIEISKKFFKKMIQDMYDIEESKKK